MRNRHEMLLQSRVLLGLCCAVFAQAASFSPVASLPGSNPGVFGQYWNVGSALATVTQDESFVASHPTPDLTFTDSTMFSGFVGSGGGGGPISGFLQPLYAAVQFATNFSGNPANSDFNHSYFVFSGYVAVNAPGTWNFGLNSDGNGEAQMLINDTVIIDHPFNSMGGQLDNTATFTSSGLYSFTIKYGHTDLGAEVQAFADQTGGTNFLAIGAGDGNTILGANDVFKSTGTPEPAVWQLCGTGIVALGILRRRRRVLV